MHGAEGGKDPARMFDDEEVRDEEEPARNHVVGGDAHPVGETPEVVLPCQRQEVWQRLHGFDVEGLQEVEHPQWRAVHRREHGCDALGISRT